MQDRLNAIEAALQSFEAGTYGQCESWGEEISDERLAAIQRLGCAQTDTVTLCDI